MATKEHLIPYVGIVTHSDPTAERAIGLAERGERKGRFPNGNRLIHEQRRLLPQAEIDGKIHALRQSLAAGKINHANYRSQMDPLRLARRQLQGGR